MPGRHGAFRFAVVSVAAATLAAVASPASAANGPKHVFIGFTGTFTLSGYCPFDVDVKVLRNTEYATTTTAPDATVTQHITGDVQVTVTNDTTGATIPLNISGPGTYTYYSNRSFSGDVTGPNLLWTLPQYTYPGVPTLAYTTGHVTFAVAANQMTTSYSNSGTQKDMCAALG